MTELNMKRLGDYIRPVDVRNRDLKVTRLVGLTIDKAFIPSVANTIGTDLSNYKVISENQFACSLMQVSRDGKMPIAMFKGEPCIMSPAYPMFEVSKTNELLPEYLMMWFSRSEFDREASFYAVGGVRGSLEWNDFCDMQIPVPAIEKQREIVAEYNTLATRIETNKKLIATLEQTAQTLYRHTFIDNIDPNNLPQGWRMGTLGEIAEFGNGKLTELCDGEYPVYGGNGIVGFTDDFNAENVIVIGRVGVNCGCLYLEPNKCWINDNAIKGFSKGLPIEFLYWHMKNMNLNAQSEGSSQPLITQGVLNSQECLLPSVKYVELFADKLKVLMNEFRLKQQENQTLTQMQNLLLSKMGVYMELSKPSMNYLPNIDLFKYSYDVPIYRDATDEELLKDSKLIYQNCGKIQCGVEKTLYTSKDVVKHIVDKNGDNEYEGCLNDLLMSFPEYKKWESAFDLSPDSELYIYQNERTSDYDKLDEEIRKYNFYLNEGQRVFRGAFGDIHQKNYSFSTPISTTLYSVVAYNEIIRNITKDEDRIIFDLVVDKSKTNVFYYGSKTGFHSNEKEVLFASGVRIQVIGDYEKIGEIDTYLGKRPLYYATGIIT